MSHQTDNYLYRKQVAEETNPWAEMSHSDSTYQCFCSIKGIQETNSLHVNPLKNIANNSDLMSQTTLEALHNGPSDP